MYFDQHLDDVLKALKTTNKGLSTGEVAKRLKEYGLNQLQEGKKETPLQIFLNEFKDFLIWMLIAAAILAVILPVLENGGRGLSVKDFFNAIIIAAILVINAIIGFIQEYRAEKAIEALKKMTALKAHVLRDGKKQEVEVASLVPGDIIFIGAGSKVPADARLIEAVNLEIQEAALTGESFPVAKNTEKLAEKTALADRKNMVFSGTIVTKGRGKGVVVETGMRTEFGKIAAMLQNVEKDETPLQKHLRKFGKQLGILILIIAAVVFIAGLSFNLAEIAEMLLFSISLAVAAVPEGLPAVVTIALAIGIQRMAKRHALMRRLPTVETLGSTSVICSDKTGTLTRNEMTVKKIFVNNTEVDVSGRGYSLEGKFSKQTNMKMLLACGALCNDAERLQDEEYPRRRDRFQGDPTEIALVVSAAKAGLDQKTLQRKNPRIYEIPFSSERKMMSTVHNFGKKKIMFTKGAPEVLLKTCSKIMINGKVKKLSVKDRKTILQKNSEFAKKSLRVLGFAYKEIKGRPVEKDLVFLGLQGMIDPPREEAKEAIKVCNEAGIRVIMITGDNKETALAVAHELGLKGKAITGEELDKKGVSKVIDEVSIYARVSPEHKLKIVDALKKQNHVVAMTGDGVNDAPALKKADIGIAMGITGTDVSKEASDMVLTDDNFKSIVNAVEEGRGIFDNIKKFVYFLLSSNLSEVLVILFAIIIGPFLGAPLPLMAVQILWINIATDGLPALALSVEPREREIMKRKPAKEDVLDKRSMIRMAYAGLIMTVGTLYLFFTSFKNNGAVYAQTVAFTTLVIYELFNSFNARSHKSVFKAGLFRNKWLIGAVILSFILQVVIVQIPFIGQAFKTTPLPLMQWLIIIAFASSVFIFDEIVKVFWKPRGQKQKGEGILG